MEKTGKSEDHKAKGKAPASALSAVEEKRRDSSGKQTASKDGAATHTESASKKRRKVNHACIYCRRSHMTCDLERPCTRCVKRNIGHLCRDEPRDADSKKTKSVATASVMDESDAQSEMTRSSIRQPATSMGPPSFDGSSRAGASSFGAGILAQSNPPQQLVQQATLARLQANASNSGNLNQFAGFSDAWITAQNQFNEQHPYHQNYMIAPEVTDEFNLLDSFLHTSLLDDSAQLSDAALSNSPTLAGANQADMLSGFLNNGAAGRQQTSLLPTTPAQGSVIPRSSNTAPAGDTDRAEQEYYLQAADPSGNDTPEERMQRVLKAKQAAGLLKPFNYIKGYHRLSTYLDSHIAPSSKQKILRTIDRFRPEFRKKAQALTDLQLVYVEMWFERQLLEYDRVFASMAIPSCLWRRTGEIYRGNKEMAKLIHVPVERLRDGNIALHEILTEDSLVRYWEEFQTIAFDPEHDSLLTACALKNPDDGSKDPKVNCAFSFMIKRDEHKMPTIIVGNFLPHDPPN